MKKTVLFVFSFFTLIKVNAEVITVNKDGSGNYITVQSAANAAQAGDTVFIYPGTYLETVIPYNSGNIALPIVYLGSEEGEVIIDAENGTREYCLRILGKSNLVFKNICFKGAYWYGIDFKGPSSNVVFDQIEISHNIHPTEDWSYGIVISGATGIIENVSLINCEIHDNRAHGLYIKDDVRNVSVDQCHIHSNGLTFDDVADNIIIADWENEENGPNGIEIKNCEIDHAARQGISTWFVKNIHIHDCHFHHNGATGIQIEDGVKNFVVENNISEWNQQHYNTETGIWIDDTYKGIVQNNIIRHNQVGIKVSKSNQVIVRNNLIYKNNRLNTEHLYNGGIIILAYDDIDNKNTAIIHNTFDEIGNPDYTNIMTGFANYYNALTDSVFIKNNIFSGIVNGYGIYVSFDTYVPGFYSDYNDFFDDEPLAVWWNEAVTWQDYINMDYEQHSIYVDPQFVDPELNDYHLSSSSECINAGDFLTYTADAGSGTVLEVENPVFFSNGVGLISADSIRVGANEPVVIADVNYADHQIIINQTIDWNQGDPVSYLYNHSAPDIGAKEYGASVHIENPEKKEAFEVSVYPNPVQNVINIKFEKPLNHKFEVEIIDINGKLLLREWFFDKNLCQIHLNGIPEGLYFLLIKTEHRSIVKKIIKFDLSGIGN